MSITNSILKCYLINVFYIFIQLWSGQSLKCLSIHARAWSWIKQWMFGFIVFESWWSRKTRASKRKNFLYRKRFCPWPWCCRVDASELEGRGIELSISSDKGFKVVFAAVVVICVSRDAKRRWAWKLFTFLQASALNAKIYKIILSSFSIGKSICNEISPDNPCGSK